jgi:hypothetical protein
MDLGTTKQERLDANYQSHGSENDWQSGITYLIWIAATIDN